eukprot:PhM_4_TR6733/c0_g1_i1/m.13913
MTLSSEEIIQCAGFFREREAEPDSALNDTFLTALFHRLNRKLTQPIKERLQDYVLHHQTLTILDFTAHLSGVLWRTSMEEKAMLEGIELDLDLEDLDEISTRYLTPTEVSKLKDIFVAHNLRSRGVTHAAVHDACEVVYKNPTPELEDKVMDQMPVRVSLSKFLRATGTIRETIDAQYRESMGVTDQELREQALFRHSSHRHSFLQGETQKSADQPSSPKHQRQANDAEEYRREFGLTARDVVQEITNHVAPRLTFENVTMIKAFYDVNRMEYACHIHPSKIATLFHDMGRPVSQSGIKTLSHLLNSTKRIHIRDFATLVAEVLSQDAGHLQVEQEEQYRTSMGVDAEEVVNTEAFLAKEARKKRLSLVHHPGIGDVLRNVHPSSTANDVEEYRNEFGVFEEPEELLSSCHGMLKVADLIDCKKFYYAACLHNNNKRFNDVAGLEKLVKDIETRSPGAWTPLSTDEINTLSEMWRGQFLTLSFFEFVTTLASHLRENQRTKEAIAVDECLANFRASGHGEDENVFHRTRDMRGMSILGMPEGITLSNASDTTTSASTRRGSANAPSSEYFRLFPSTPEKEDDDMAAQLPGRVLTPHDVMVLRIRMTDGHPLTPWKVHVMMKDINHVVTMEGQFTLSEVLRSAGSFKDALHVIASYVSRETSQSLRKEIAAYKRSLGEPVAEPPTDLQIRNATAIVSPGGLSPKLSAARPNDVEEFRREFGVTSTDVISFLYHQCHGELSPEDLALLKGFFSKRDRPKPDTELVRSAASVLGRELTEGQIEATLQPLSAWKHVSYEDFARVLGLALFQNTEKALKQELEELKARRTRALSVVNSSPTLVEMDEIATLVHQTGSHFTTEQLREAVHHYKELNLHSMEDKWHLVAFLTKIRRHLTDASIDEIASHRLSYTNFSSLMLAISNALTWEERAFRQRQLKRYNGNQ